ncbi:MAG: lipase family protein [Microthrixaceae bacterium]
MRRRPLTLALLLTVATLAVAAPACGGTKKPPPMVQAPCAGPGELPAGTTAADPADGTASTTAPTTTTTPAAGSAGAPAPRGTGPGDLVGLTELRPTGDQADGFPTGARMWRMLYVSSGVDEKDLRLVCGTVTVPEGGPREFGGSGRIYAWAHGTQGLEQQCLPSSDPATGIWGPMSAGIQTISWGALLGKHQGEPSGGLLQGAVDRGWMVATSDYQPGDTYIIGRVAGANVLDAARAATQLASRTYTTAAPDRYDMVINGHSQGGHASLWAGQLAEPYLAGTSPVRPTAPIRLVGVAAMAPASNFIAQPDLQPGLALGDGLADREMHQSEEIIPGVAIPGLEVQVGPVLLSYIFGSWSRYAAGGSPSPGARFPSYPAGDRDLRLGAVTTAEGRSTVNSIMGLCLGGSDATEVKQLTDPYRDAATNKMLVPALWNLPADYEAGQYFRGGVDRACATGDVAGLTDWCRWIRWNLPGPVADNPYPKWPQRGGRPVPMLLAQGTADTIIHCVAPDGLADDEVPGASDCMTTALYDALHDTAYCPKGENRASLTYLTFRAQTLVSPATHLSLPGQLSARSLGKSAEDLSFTGSPLEQWVQSAFDGTLRSGCEARVLNP